MKSQELEDILKCRRSWGMPVEPRNTRKTRPARSPAGPAARQPRGVGVWCRGQAGTPMATAAAHNGRGTAAMAERGDARPRLTFFPLPQSRQLGGPRCGRGALTPRGWGPSHHPGAGDPHTILGPGTLTPSWGWGPSHPGAGVPHTPGLGTLTPSWGCGPSHCPGAADPDTVLGPGTLTP